MKFLLLETIQKEARDQLLEHGEVHLIERAEKAILHVKENPVDAIITRGRGRVPRTLIENCQDLKVIARVGVGVDNIDIEAASESGIPVINAPGSTTTATAEHTILLMLMLVRQIYPMMVATKTGNWSVRGEYDGDELTDKTLGIVGMGAIGQRVAELATSFGMKIQYWNRSEKPLPFPQRTLSDVLSTSDVVSVHVALTPQTRGLLGAVEFATMKPGALLINTARGAVLDQDALLERLKEGQLGGFAADVLSTEPPDVNDPILSHPRTLITPHISALTRTSFRKMCLRTVSNIVALLQDEPFEVGCIVNREALEEYSF